MSKTRGVIFGSGIVGLVAKKILSGDWTVIPFGRSRFYSFNPPLGDNFITSDKDLDPLIRDLCGDARTFMYSRSYSKEGKLVAAHDQAICNEWLNKVFSGQTSIAGATGTGELIPGQAMAYMSKRTTIPIYGARVNQLYQSLQNEFLVQLKAEAVKGQVTEVGKNYFIRGGQREEFDRAISTIPLSALMDLMGRESSQFTYADEHFVLVKSPNIDLEGYNQALVVDPLIDFYKVTNVAPQFYMFYFLNDIPMVGNYLMPIIGAAEIFDGTRVSQSIPTGPTPDISWLDDYDISCIGSHAQHDWFADVGSNLLKLVRLSQRGFKNK